MTHATEMNALRAECDELREQNARLREALVELSVAMRRAEEFHAVHSTDECWEDVVANAEALVEDTERHAPGCLADKGNEK